MDGASFKICKGVMLDITIILIERFMYPNKITAHFLTKMYKNALFTMN